jgi:hypothetical protein
MKQRIDLRFRPSLIIFIGEVGQQVRQQFERVVHVTDLDSVLYQSIGLLQVSRDFPRARAFRLGQQGAEGEAAAEAGPLGELIDRMLRDVQANRRITEITDAGYPVPNTRTQVYIVGRANSSRVARVLHAVNVQLAASRFSTLICYILIAHPNMPEDSGPLPDLNLAEADEAQDEPFDIGIAATVDIDAQSDTEDEETWPGQGREITNFCYLYEDMQSHPTPTFVTAQESYHAAAEGLFALIATGITPEPVFEQQMQPFSPLTDPELLRREQERLVRAQAAPGDPAALPASTGEPAGFSSYENVGSLSTSLIIFPRRPILEYCSARLGVALTLQWTRDLDAHVLPESVRRKLQEQAQMHVNQIEKWIGDGWERPYTRSPYIGKWRGEIAQGPGLDILAGTESLAGRGSRAGGRRETPQSERELNNQKRAHRQVRTESAGLFRLFWTEEIEREQRRLRRQRDAWTKLVYQQEGKALEAYKQWDKAATAAWEAAEGRIAIEERHLIDRLWGEDDSGFEQAIAYVDELDDRLGILADRMSRWRELHEQEYHEALDSFEELADGPWNIPPGSAGIIGNPAVQEAAQAAPTLGGRGVAPDARNAAVPGGGAGIIGGTRSASPAYQHLPVREERLARSLEQRVLWLQARVPLVLTQITIGIPAVIALVLAAFTFVPTTLLWGVLLVLATLIVLGGIHGLFRWNYLKQVREAREDLLNFYRCYYAHRCAEREDKLRLLVLGPLRRKVQAIRDRLDDMRNFVDALRSRMDTRALRVEHELFESPASVRDVYIAHGERLQRERKNTLEDFVGQVTRQRTKEPVREWHRSSQEMKRQLIVSFRQRSESILEMSEEEAEAHIYAFAETVTADYLKGALVDIQEALDQPDVWSEALKRASHPLYRARVGMRDPHLVFVCGREQDIMRGEQATLTRNHHSRLENAYAVSISERHLWVLVAAFFRGGLPEAFDPERLFPVRKRSSLDSSGRTVSRENGV